MVYFWKVTRSEEAKLILQFSSLQHFLEWERLNSSAAKLVRVGQQNILAQWNECVKIWLKELNEATPEKSEATVKKLTDLGLDKLAELIKEEKVRENVGTESTNCQIAPERIIEAV